MNRFRWSAMLGLAALLAASHVAQAQRNPYIGYVYPAGGQQGATFQVKLGGQYLDGVHGAVVSGTGVSAKLVKYYGKLGPQEMSLLREQLNVLKRKRPAKAKDTMMMEAAAKKTATAPGKDKATLELIERIESRMAEYVNRPACTSIASLVYLEVTMAPDAQPGPREIRLTTEKGVSNPLAFHVGQFPEVTRKPMRTADFQVLGKEELALRKRPEEEVEERINVPCTMNGQIASGEVNRYRFEASKGQRLVISTLARQLIPYIADAVPGWFQPVITLYDADGKQVAYNDDYRFKPDPTILYEVPKSGEYVLTITDAIYRGREDFVYRITIGAVPFVTSIFPLGGKAGVPVTVEMQGWDLGGAEPILPAPDAAPGIHFVAARKKNGMVSNRVPFALDTLPECFDEENNNDPSHAQKVKLPVIVNGRVDHPNDWDVFQVEGRAGDMIVVEVSARRLDSPLDSLLKLTDASGKLLAFNDDHEDFGDGMNTHHADSYLITKFPADGTYYVHLGDTAQAGGEAFGYRLRISPPQPDFALRVVPSAGALRSKGSGPATVYAIRKDGFAGPIKLSLKDQPGFSAFPVTLSGTQTMVRFVVKTDLAATEEPVNLVIEGRTKVEDREISHQAVPAEDRMQAFLWRHLVPAEDLKVLVYNSSAESAPKRVLAPNLLERAKAASAKSAEKPKFTKRQVTGRLRQLDALYQDGFFTDEFYAAKVAECEAAL